jgi:NADPH2:quinone reductase
MSKQFRIYAHGGPEVLRWEDVAVGAPGPGEVLVRHTAVGLNFSDVYLRTGLYPRPLPSAIGTEAAGVIAAIGKKVKGFKAGDHVVYHYPVPGAYSEQRILPAAALLKIPRGVSDEQAAAVLFKGLTTWVLLRQCYRVKRGETVLIQAASGGVGLIASQWARALGARVIGVVGSPEKAALAKKNGCHHVFVGIDALAAKVRQWNKGQGVDVVYDGTGKDTFFASLDCLRPRGMMVGFGNASGPVAPFSPMELFKRGSLYYTRVSGSDYLADHKARQAGTRELFGLMKKKKIRVHIGQRFALADAARAQAELEARGTIGSTVLLPDGFTLPSRS